MKETWRYAALLLYLLAAAVTDIKTKKVSAALAAFMGLAAIVAQAVWHPLSMGNWIAGVLPGMFLLAIGFLTRESVGYGDGIILLVCGSILGFWGCLEVFLLGLFLTFPFSLFLIAGRRADRKKEIPFVPFLLAGYGIWLFAFW